MTDHRDESPRPDHRDESLRADLSRAVGRELPGWTVDSITQLGAGRSAVTVTATLSGPAGTARSVAVRATPAGRPGLAIASLTSQYAVLSRLHRDGFPVPAPVLVAEASDQAAHDILVTEYIDGEVPDPWRRDGRARIMALAANERFVEDFVGRLAGIHALRDGDLPPDLRHGDAAGAGYLARTLARIRATVAESAFADDPVLTYTGNWIERNDGGRARPGGLIHGDYRMGNIVVRDDRLVGILDWELAESGETLSDLAWLCGPQALTEGRPAGLYADLADLLARYEKATGLAIDDTRLRLLTVGGTLRTAAVWSRLSIEEARRGDASRAARCRDSVVEMIGLCAEVTGLRSSPGQARPSQPSRPSQPGLLRAVAAEAGAVLAELDHELAERPSRLTPGMRNARLLLRRISTLTDQAYETFADGVRRLLDDLGCDHEHAEEFAAGRALSHALREHEYADESVRDLVAMAARPDIAFANLALARSREA
jgi:aminoglycoside phosphotransferase (APT) family kinase protein